MKRKVGFFVVIATLGLAVYVGSRLSAQGTGSSRPTSKIAVVNLPLVIKKYDKYLNFEKELEGFAKKYQEREEKIKNNMLQIQRDIQKRPADRDTLEAKYKDKKREMEDLGMEFKKVFDKKREDQLIVLYREVEDMVTRVAKARGFEMVMQFGDAIDPKDKYNPMIIQRKVLGGMCLPMYAMDGLDISVQVYKNLNYYYEKKSAKRK